MYYNMFIYIIWCGMADDMMKKEVKTTRQDDVVAGRVRVFDESFHDGCLFLKLLTLHSLQKGLE